MSKMSKWTGLFFSKWTGLEFSKKKIIVRISGQKRSEKIGEIRVTFDNLEKMRKFF